MQIGNTSQSGLPNYYGLYELLLRLFSYFIYLKQSSLLKETIAISQTNLQRESYRY